MRHAPYVAVVGASRPSDEQFELAEKAGRALARAGAVVITGGRGGVMEAASRGAAREGGVVVGLLPGDDREEANPWVGVALPTGLGDLRNGLVVRCADGVLAVGGAYGTLSEVALALVAGRPVVGLQTWDVDGVEVAGSPEAAATRVLELVQARRGG